MSLSSGKKLLSWAFKSGTCREEKCLSLKVNKMVVQCDKYYFCKTFPTISSNVDLCSAEVATFLCNGTSYSLLPPPPNNY
jgi:hypothetical protein